MLFYARQLAVPWLDGAGHRVMTGQLLWPDFTAHWPCSRRPAGATTQAMPWQGIPLINTLILLGSSVTLLFAHMSLENGRRMRLKGMLLATVVLGLIFLWFQGYEYLHAYRDLGLRLDSGIYGNTFFILTGFHGLHVLLGTLFLTIIWLRIMLRIISPHSVISLSRLRPGTGTSSMWSGSVCSSLSTCFDAVLSRGRGLGSSQPIARESSSMMTTSREKKTRRPRGTDIFCVLPALSISQRA